MDTMVESGHRHSAALPSINFLDAEKTRREREEAEHHQRTQSMVSPSFNFSCPPPHNHNTSTSVATSSSSGLISPPDSRRTSGDEAPPNLPARQSLPSIHEALGRDTPLGYPGPPGPPPPPLPPPPPSSASTSTSTFFSHSTPTIAPDSSRRPYPTASQASEPPFSPPSARSPFMNQQPQSGHVSHQPPHSQPEPIFRPSKFSSESAKLLSLKPIRTSPPQSSAQPYPHSGAGPAPVPAPAAYDAGPQSAPPNASFGYSNYQSSYPYQSSTTGGPSYPSPGAHSAPSGYPPGWRSEADIRAEERQRQGRVVAPAYGESVKRHLDSFELAMSLNEITDNCNRLLEFTRTYSQRAHQANRSGMVPGSIPTLQEIDDLLPKAQILRDSLNRIRDVVLTCNATMAEQPKDVSLAGANGFVPEQNGYQEEQKASGGFAGADPKKRRGRAAPPGRCHSCNRAETPEWRRGPDGARTLCNACGLHYAKLTRKMGTSKAAIQNSNLRPKSMGPSSPTT